MSFEYERFSSPRFRRRAVWVGLVVVAVAAATVSMIFFRNPSASLDVVITDTQTGTVATTTEAANVALDPAARRVAREFILTAVGRERLSDSYDITHSTLRQGLSRKEWMTGNIPVVYYPAQAIETAAFTTEISKPDEALLQVALMPKEGAGVKPQVFYIGLKRVHGAWLVDFWAPIAR